MIIKAIKTSQVEVHKMDTPNQIWQVKVEERYYEARFDELIQWISEGALLPEDLVTRGNLRWLEAGKVPVLYQHFLDFERAREIAPPENIKEIYTNFQVEESEDNSRPFPRISRYSSSFTEYSNKGKVGDPITVETDNQICYFHPENRPHFYCGICLNCFCKDCTNSFGSVKLCPLCGGLCDLFEGQINNTTHGAINKPYKRVKANQEVVEIPVEAGLTIKDLIKSFIFPLKFPLSLGIGFLLFTIFGIGIGVLLIGHPIMSLIGLVSLFLIVMLQFGEFSKTLENLLQHDIQSSYMPHVNKYSIIEDFIHPFFMGGAVYLVSFGLFLIIGLGTLGLVHLNFLNQLDATETEMRKKNNEIEFILAKNKSSQNVVDQESPAEVNQATIEELVDQSRENQTTSILGNNYLGDNEGITKLVTSFLRLSIHYQMPLFLSFILGILYFPIACSIAGSTRSIAKILNPWLGCKTIKKLGFDYIKILCLLLTLVLVSMAIVVSMFWFFSNLNLPLLGIFSSIGAGTLLMSYFWIVYSEFLGISVSNKLIFQRWLNLRQSWQA